MATSLLSGSSICRYVPHTLYDFPVDVLVQKHCTNFRVSLLLAGASAQRLGMVAQLCKEPAALSFSTLCGLFDDLHDCKGAKVKRKVARYIKNNILDGACNAFQVMRLLLPKARQTCIPSTACDAP